MSTNGRHHKQLEALRHATQTRCTPAELEAINLVFLQHLGTRKAAEQLGITRRSVRDRLDSARVRLRQSGVSP